MIDNLIVVGVDDRSDGCEAALVFAADEANRLRADVKLVHGLAPSWGLTTIEPVYPFDQRAALAEELLLAAAARMRTRLDEELAIVTDVSTATGSQVLVEESGRARLVVLQRREISRLAHVAKGSTTSTVATRAGCPVVVVKDLATDASRSGVVVGVDDAGHAGRALTEAFAEASRRHATLTAVHVRPSRDLLTGYGWVPAVEEDFEERRQLSHLGLAEALAGYGDRYPEVVVTQRVVDGGVATSLVQASLQAELLVVARHGKVAVGTWGLGRTARACLDAAPCPVLVTPDSRSVTARPRPPREVPAGPIY